MKSKKLSKTAIRNASIAAASAAVAGVLTGCSLYGNDTYTVKFNTVGGSSVESQKIVWGEKINNPASPTKEGYTFDGWYLDANYKTKVDEVNYVVEGDVEFFAKWKINSYTITFATNGGEKIDPITKNYNSTISIDDPEREGYIFDGWYLDAALTKPFNMVVPSSDTTVYAKWIACELTITFDKNSEEAVGEMEVQTIKTNATLNQISTNTFKREGYTFAGWAISPEGEVAYQENEAISLVNQNKEITLYAVWEANDYTVSFIANNEEFATFTGDYRSQFTLPNNTPTRNGYTFVNWGTYKLTEDEKFKGEKQYFSNVGTEKEPIYELISVVDGADVAAGLYYEIVEYTNREIPLNGLKLFAIFTKNTYTISFNTNGGSAIANISSLYGEEITKPASPTKEGYTFKGWFTSQGQTNDDWGNEYIVFSTMPSNSFTLYAKWEINNYALSFNSNGGNEIDPLNKAFGSEVILPSLTRTGYTFKGWATSLDGEVTYLAGAKYTITSSSQVLHAVWEIKSLTISFEENGGSEVLDITQEYNSSITQPENPSRVGYTFDGWFTDKTFKNEYVFSTMPEENVTLYAKWNINQYTISFNSLGGSEINPITQNYDSTISSPSSPTKAGHSFAGWYLDEECTKEYTISKMPAENITLYAKWEINQYTISFNTLGGNVIDSITQNYNTSVTQPENPSRVGYTFDGWYSDRSCSIEYTFSNMPAENITLFAGWTLNSYSISFNVDGGSEVATIKQDYNTSLAKPNNPSKLGYSFAGWYLDEECTIAYTFPSTMPAENITLYAKWEINQYTITFNTNGGSDVAPITLDYNSSLVRPADPSKVGRTFAGWYSNIECTKPYIFPDKMPAENVTVYAKWSVNSYTVSFNVNGGDTLQPITMKYNESFYLPTPTKTGHTFLGWATSLDGEVVYRENAIYTLGATNVTLYAKWEINQYTISFNTKGGDVVSPITQDYNTILLMPTNPSKNGYTFDGWYLDEALSSPFSSSRMPAENITLYAKWNVNSYTVSFDVDDGNPVSSITKEFNETITLPTPTKTGHTFLGWATSKDGEVVYRENAIYTLGATNVTLYAKWEVNEYSLSFIESDGSTLSSIKLDYGSSYTLHELEKEGHTFAGWATSQGGSVVYRKGEAYTIGANNASLYAVWIVNQYTISFEENGGSLIDNITQNYGTDITVPSTPTLTGNSFKGWFKNKECTEKYNFPETMPAENITLYAKWEANQYTISFNTKGGDVVSPITQDYNTILLMPTNPSKTGYAFDGWYLDETLTSPFSYSRMPAENITLYAKWNVISYTVSFNVDGGGAISPITEEFSSSITLPTPTKTGHTFLGWATSKDGEVVYRENASYTLGASNVTLYAKWNINQYSITFEENGGSSVTDITLNYNESITKPSNPTKEGHTFAGWFLDSNYQNSYSIPNTMPATNVTVYAKWNIDSYTISFDSNDGISINPVTSIYNSEITLPSTTKTGYHLLGWALVEDDISNIRLAGEKYSIPSSNVTLHAIWEANTNTKYVVNHYGANLTGGGYTPIISENLEGTTDAMTSVEYVSTLDKLSPFYGFEGVIAITQEKIKPDGTTVINLYYQRRTYTVSFIDEEGNPLCSPINVIYQGNVGIIPSELVRTGYDCLLSDDFTAETIIEEDVTIVVTYDAREISIAFYNYPTNENPNIQTIVRDCGTDISSLVIEPIRTGYTFEGWFTLNGESSGDWGEEYSFTTMPEESIELYAKWSVNQYKLSFNTNGGDSISSITQDYGSSYTLPFANKVGHTFLGWATSLDGEVVATGDVNYTFVAQDVILYAKWKVNQYTISFDVDDGNPISPITEEFNETIDLPTPTKTGHTFLGWAIVENGEVVYRENATYTLGASNVTLYAKWEVNQYTITINTVGGSDIAPITQNYNTAITQPTDPTKLGHSFAGWYSDSSYTTTYSFPNTMPATNVTVYAKWNVTSYTVSFDVDDGNPISPITEEFNETIDLPTPTKTGHTFLGWAIVENGEVVYRENATYTLGASNVTLYAKWEVNQYSLSFIESDGSTLSSINLDYGSSYTLHELEKEGHTFAGWATSQGGSVVYRKGEAYTIGANNASLYAVWIVNQYTISFNSNGGDNVANITQNYGTSLVMPSNPTLTGYTFKGWHTDVECTEEYDFPETMPAENITLYAKWEVNQYTITINTVGGSDIAPITQNYNTAITQPTDPTKLGHSFAGWYSDSSYTTTYSFPSTMPATNVTVYAKWNVSSYTVSFDVDDGNPVSSITKEFNETITLPTPTKTGHTFLGWATSQGGEVVYRENATYTLGASNVTLYAKWEVNEYSLSFIESDGSTLSSIKLDYGSSYTLHELEKEGHTFAGWATSQGGSVVYRKGEAYTIGANNASLYAVWIVNQYTISFNSNGGDNVANITQNYGTSLVMPSNPTLTGYTFKGWHTDVECTEAYSFPSTMPAGNITLYAKWEINQYTITINTVGGSDISPIKQNYNTTITQPTDPTKLGHSFGGWYSDSSYTTTYSFPSTMPATNVTVYAKWNVNSYTISFEENGGSTVNNITQNYGTSLVMPSNPTLTGYTFKGWHTDVECTEAYTFPDTMPAGNITLYAKWEINQYIVSFNSNGGDAVEAMTINYKDIVTKPTDPTKLGHSFAGWYSDPQFKSIYSFGQEMPAESFTLYAKWNVNSYTISFEENGGSTVNNITQNYGTSLVMPSNPTLTGYTFKGWYLDKEFTEAYEFPSIMPAGNITLYAKWEIKQFTVSFEENGGSSVTDITLDYQANITRPSDPTKDGHTFAGWYLDPQFKFVYSFGQMPAENITVYAKWNVNSYMFTLVNDGIVTSNQVLAYGSTLNLPTLTKYGYEFKGWALIEDGEVEYEGNSLYSITSENVTLYAIWDVKQVTYKFSVNGIVKNTITNDYDSDFSVANPTSYSDENNTYYFAGWKEKDAEENAPLYDFSNGSKLGMENKEYVAVFNSVPYTIKYQNKNGGTTLWETSSSAEDSSFKQYIAYLYQRQQAFSFISKGIKTAVKGTDPLPITVTATYFTLLLNPSLTVGALGVPFNVLPFENQVAVLANQTSTTTEYALNVMNILSVFDLNNNNDLTYITYVSKFDPKDMAAMEVASTATSEYLTLVSAELTKYEDNAYNPYRNDGYIFNGWKTTIDADNENPTKYVYASWVKQIEAPENLRVSTIAKTYVEFSWNQVENAYGYYVNYSINGEAKPTIATQENKVPINVSANDTIEISVTTINADENGNRFETSNAYETPSLKDENITLTQESVSLNSEPCSPISYTHIITGEQEITASGDFFYKTEYGELYLFSNSSYTFKNVVAMEIISGNSFARITDQNGTPTLTTGSNAGTITFRTYKVASGTAKENETYYSYVDGSYSLVSVEVGYSVEGYYLGEEHIAKISLLVSNIGLGTELYSYTSAETSGDYLNTTEFDAYLIGAALTDSSLYTEYASGNYSNGFKFDFDINTTSGNILDFSTFPLEYTFYELDGNEWKEVSDPSSLYIYDEEQDVFYFLKSSGQYKVSISFKKDGYYETKDSSLDPNKKYYYLENGEYKLFDHENPVDATTYYEHFVNVSLPNAFKERNISKEFEFTLNDGINVFNDYGLKQAFSNKNVSSINLHSTIKSEFNSHSISYIPYLEDTGLSTKMSHSYMKYGELDIVSGTAEMTDNPSYGPLCWKQSSSTTSELDAAGTFYFLDKSGVVYVYDYTNGTHAIKDCEWKEVYGNTETKVGKFKILNDAFGNDPTYNNYGLSVGSIYTRANKESVDLKVNGNYFTIDASDLPYVMSTYGNVAGNGIVASYKIQNVKVSIFDIISGTGTSFENMSVIGNTENASETLSGSSGESLTISEQMEKTSGGILAFKNMYIGSDINLDNINISKATIGVHTTYLANATINYTHVWDIWANSIYASGGDTTSVSNSVIDPSGGASFHIEDNFYTIDDKGSGYAYNGVIVNNSGVVTNPTFDLGYISTHANNLVSGEEQWFKAYSMEIVAMGMKSTLESAVQNDINPQIGSNYTILQTVTDPVTNLTSEKMNFVFLGKTHNINQSNTAINLDDVKVDFTFGGPIINTQTTNQGIVYTIAKEEVENPQDAEIIYNVLCVPLPEDLGTLYFITSPDGSTTLKAYFFFKNKLSATEIIYGMVELYEKQ